MMVEPQRRYSWTESKRALNLVQHGIDFSIAERFDWSTAVIFEDLRRDYGEHRFIAFGKIGTRVHVLVFTPRGEGTHIISLRKANGREIRRYEKDSEP
jgi:uncharacterized DUF497 family protein